MGLRCSIVHVVLLTDITVVETLVRCSQLITVRSIQEADGMIGATRGLHITRVVERRYEADAVPGTNAVVRLAEVVGVAIPHTHHGAYVRDGIGSTLSVFGCQCKDHLWTLHVVNTIEVTIVGVQSIGAVSAVDNLLRQCLALIIVALSDKHLCVQQQTGLQHTVHSLISTVHGSMTTVFLGQCFYGLVELGSDKVIDDLTRGIPVGISCSGHLTASRGVQRQCSAPEFEDTIVVPGAQCTDLGHILFQSFLRDAQTGGIKTFEVVKQQVSQSYGGPCSFPGIVDNG